LSLLKLFIDVPPPRADAADLAFLLADFANQTPIDLIARPGPDSSLGKPGINIIPKHQQPTLVCPRSHGK